jgi:hypothetical protein
MSSGQIFVTFVIPAFVVAIGYFAMRFNERAAHRLDRPPGE